MALQKITIPSAVTANGYTLKLALTENSVSTANNTSSVSWRLYLTAGDWNFEQYQAGWSVSLNGTVISSQSRSSAPQLSIAKHGEVTVKSGTVTVAHSADGTLNMAVSASLDMVSLSHTPGPMSLSGSMPLTAIPRASTLTASGGTLGTAQTLTINRASTAFTHTLTYKCGSESDTIVSKTSSTSVSWTPPKSLAAQASNSKTVSVAFTLTTWSDDTKVGTSTKTVSMTIPASTLTVPSGTWTLGTAKTLTINRAASNLTHTISYTCGSGGGSVSPSTTKTSVSWTSPKSLAAQASNSATVSVTLKLTTYNGSSKVGTDSKSVTMTIPASTLTVSDGTLGKEQTLTINRAAGNLTHTLSYNVENGAITGDFAMSAFSGGDTKISRPWTPKMEWAAANTTDTTVNAQLTLTTMCGSATVGTATRTVSLSIPSSVKPTLTAGDVTVQVVNSNATVSGWGVAVKGFSKYNVTAAFNSAQGSTLKSRSVKVFATGQTLTASPATSATSAVLTSTNRKVSVKVTDSRDRASDTVTVNGPTIYDYGPPTLSNVKAYRCDSNNNESDTGTKLRVKCTGAVSSCGKTNGSANNRKTLEYRYRVVGGSWPSTWTSLSSGVETTDPNATLNISKAYEVVFRVTDSLGGTSSVVMRIPSAAVTLNLKRGGSGAAFGGYAQRDNAVDFTTWDVVGRLVGLGYCPDIAANADLDSYTTPGVWTASNAVAGNLTHVPEYHGGRLTVISALGRRYDDSSTNVFLRQIYATYNGRIYQRCGDSSTGLANLSWGSWVLIASPSPIYSTGTVTYSTTYASGHDLVVRKYPLLGMCYVEGTFTVDKAVSAGTAVTIATLPTGFRPGRTVPLAVSMGSGVGAVHITSGGALRYIRTTAIASGSSVDVRVAGWFLVA